MNLYTYEETARLLSLGSRESVRKRMLSLAKRGQPLTVEAGELQQVGARLMITEAGLERLRAFEPGRNGRPPKDQAASQAGNVKQ